MKLFIDEVQLSDFAQILSISKENYFGNDYLPHMFKFWVEEEKSDPEKRRNFVLKDEDGAEPLKILGFQSFMFLVSNTVAELMLKQQKMFGVELMASSHWIFFYRMVESTHCVKPYE